MLDNPYESPQMSRSVTPPLDYENELGLWRDGKQLVMRMRDAQFPPRCIKTNFDFEGSPTLVKLEWIPNSTVWVLMFGLLGHVIAKSLYGKSLTIQVPVSQTWLAEQKRKSRIGWTIIIVGICCFVLGTIGFVAASAARVSKSNEQMLMVAVLITPLIALAGLVYMAVSHKAVVSARKITEEYAWLNGVGSDFLDTLPVWPR